MPLERVSQGFKDLSMTFKRNPLNDDLIALKNETAIARSIRNIVFTVPGERFFDNSLTPVEPKMPDFKVSTRYYQVENGFERLGMGREDEYFWKTAKERENLPQEDEK